MTTVNGKPVPYHYGSINDLPAVIEELDHDWPVWPDGNYTEDEMDWLHQFHIYCGERHYINETDIEHATLHGPMAFIKLDAKQKRDLAAYFSNVFPNYTTTPTQNYQHVKDKPVTQLSRIDGEDHPANHDVTAKATNSIDIEQSIDDLGADFTENILPESKRSLYRDAIKPLMSYHLEPQDQLQLLQELTLLDATTSDLERVDGIMAVLSYYDIDDSSLAFLLSGQYYIRPITSNSTIPDLEISE